MDWTLALILFPIGYFVLRVIEGIIASILGNILTNPLKNWWENRSLVNKRKRIDQLKREFNEVSEFHHDKLKLYLKLLRSVLYMVTMTWSSILSFLVVFSEGSSNKPLSEISQPALFLAAVCIVTVVAAFRIFFSIDTLIERVLKYDKYQAQIDRRITELSACRRRASSDRAAALPPRGRAVLTPPPALPAPCAP